MMDEIELVDRDYEKCTVEKAPRQIKTRKFSFSSIRERWNNFRIANMKKKLDKMENAALNAGYSEKNFEKQIEKKANAIAKLEEKIKILSKENVPTNYAKRRAIKLKKKMSENLSYNSSKIYSIGIDKKDEIFAAESPEEILEQELTEEEKRIQEEISRSVNQIMEEEKVESVSSDDLRDAVNETFDAMEKDEVQVEAEKIVSSEDVRAAVNETFDELSGEKKVSEGVISGDDVRAVVNEKFDEIVPDETKKDEVVIGGDEVRAAVNEAFADLDKDAKVTADGALDVAATNISRDAVKEAINDAFKEVKVEETTTTPIPEIVDPFVEEKKPQDEVVQQQVATQGDVKLSKEEIEAAINEVIDRIKVSKNKASAVKFEKYNEDGTTRSKNDEYVYTPMTDEEIRASQEKLGFDEHGNLIQPVTNAPVDTDVKAVDTEAKAEEKKYVYTPMTDEEIRESQEKLGFDEHGNLVNPPKANYDIVATAKVVNDERSPLYVETGVSSLKDTPAEVVERSARTVQKNIDYDLGTGEEELEEFVESEVADENVTTSLVPVSDEKVTTSLVPVADENDTGAVISSTASTDETVSSKIDDYNSLKEKLLELQKKQALTMQKREAAQKEAAEAADAALKIKQEVEASEKSVSRSMEMLKAYTEALEEDCERNVSAAELAENDAKINKNFIDVQKNKMDANNRLIDEIDSLIGPRAVPDSIKVR